MSNASSEVDPAPKASWLSKLARTILIVVATLGLFLASQLLGFVLVAGSVGLLHNLGWITAYPADIVDSTIGQFTAIILAEIILVAVVAGVLRWRGLSLRSLGFDRPQAKHFTLFVGACAVYYAMTIATALLLTQLVPGLDASQKQDLGLDRIVGNGQLLMAFVALVIVAPVAEEVLFRGYLFGHLRYRLSFVTATIITSLLFGAAHLAGGAQGLAAPLWIAAADTLILSLVLCYLREKTGQMWAPIALHSTKNGISFALLYISQLS